MCPRKNPPPSEPFETFPKPCRRPLFEASAETPAGPPFGECHLSRKSARSHFSESPLSTRLRNRPFGLSFGTCHVSRRLSRKLPRKPFEAAPRYLSVLSSEHATCFRVPSENPFSGSPPSRHVSRDSPWENPEYLPEAPNALRTRVPSEISPNASGCAACPKPRDHSDTARQPRESPPEDPPGHSANAPRVPVNSRKSNKMF